MPESISQLSGEHKRKSCWRGIQNVILTKQYGDIECQLKESFESHLVCHLLRLVTKEPLCFLTRKIFIELSHFGTLLPYNVTSSALIFKVSCLIN